MQIKMELYDHATVVDVVYGTIDETSDLPQLLRIDITETIKHYLDHLETYHGPPEPTLN